MPDWAADLSRSQTAADLLGFSQLHNRPEALREDGRRKRINLVSRGRCPGGGGGGGVGGNWADWFETLGRQRGGGGGA